MSRAVRTLFLAVALALAGTATAHAGIWTEVPSNTTEDITAVEYRGGDRFWFATANGKIFRRVGGAFQSEYTAAGVIFRDIEFDDAGTVGLAVGSTGTVVRTVDGGDTWNPVVLPPSQSASSETDCNGDEAPGDLDSVVTDGLGRAWIAGSGAQLWKSAGTGAMFGVSFVDANNGAGVTCNLPRDIDDMFFVPGTESGYFIAKSFGQVYFTSNALAGAASEKNADAGNGFVFLRRVAGDPANPNRMWAVVPGGDGPSYIKRTTDGWNSALDWAIGNPDVRNLSESHDVDYAGGTVLSAGSAGLVLHSIDGATFYYDGADGALATQDWRAVSLADGANGAIGGTNGKLATTAAANVVPDVIKPTGTISGPSSVKAGEAATFSLNATDAGGSGLNPASITWTTPGLPNQTGQSVAFAFPNQGSATITVTFADNAGNTETATKFVTITKGTAATLPVSFTGPGNTLSAKIVGRFIRVTMKGAITPAGGASAAACAGKVTLRIKKGTRVMANRKVRLKLRDGKCRFSKVVKLRRSKVGRTNRLRLTVSHPGNTILTKSSKKLTLVIRK